MSSNLGVVKYLIAGKAKTCFNLAGDWAQEAVDAAEKGLSEDASHPQKATLSCASEVLKKMGASEEETMMVAGFAGGHGLSGNGCGALAAAIWLKTLRVHQIQKKKPGMSNPEAKKLLKDFQVETEYEMECKVMCSMYLKREFKLLYIEYYSLFITVIC